MSNNGNGAKTKFYISLLIAHHNCPKLANSSNPARPVMKSIGKDDVHNSIYYGCPACGMEIMLSARVTEHKDEGE